MARKRSRGSFEASEEKSTGPRIFENGPILASSVTSSSFLLLLALYISLVSDFSFQSLTAPSSKLERCRLANPLFGRGKHKSDRELDQEGVSCDGSECFHAGFTDRLETRDLSHSSSPFYHIFEQQNLNAAPMTTSPLMIAPRHLRLPLISPS